MQAASAPAYVGMQSPCGIRKTGYFDVHAVSELVNAFRAGKARTVKGLDRSFSNSTQSYTILKRTGGSNKNMQTTDIEREIRTFLVNNYLFGRTEALRDDESLLDSVIDSTGVLELVVFLQDSFAIVVEDSEVAPENLESLRTVVTFVERKLANKT
jgi:acyl carrier protein